jgi:hypothetical protein
MEDRVPRLTILNLTFFLHRTHGPIDLSALAASPAELNGTQQKILSVHFQGAKILPLLSWHFLQQVQKFARDLWSGC